MLAFGSPFGLNQTVTHGIISATQRGQINLGSTIRLKEFLQTDAAINPGSSGGPLVDLDGKVVGINTAIASKSGDNSGVSFSIPANMVKRIATQLIEKGSVTRGYLGVQLASTLDPAEALRLGLSRVNGAYVEIVTPERRRSRRAPRACHPSWRRRVARREPLDQFDLRPAAGTESETGDLARPSNADSRSVDRRIPRAAVACPLTD